VKGILFGWASSALISSDMHSSVIVLNLFHSDVSMPSSAARANVRRRASCRSVSVTPLVPSIIFQASAVWRSSLMGHARVRGKANSLASNRLRALAVSLVIVTFVINHL
jgi:hypothetical protein